MSVNVLDYGAGSGNPTVDTQAIRNAIAAVQAGSDRTLYFPHGTYYINDTISFASWSDPWSGYTVDFGGSVIRTYYLPADHAAFEFSNNKLLAVGGGLQLLGDPSTNGANTVGIRVNGLQPDGLNVATFKQIFVRDFRTGWEIGSPSWPVAHVEFHNLQTERCSVGFHVNGPVSHCRFSEAAVSGEDSLGAGFWLTQSGALTFEACTGYGNFPLFVVDGPVDELKFSGCQNESNTDDRSYLYFMKRLQSGSGNGVPRPMVISNSTIEAPIVLGNPGSQTGGATQAIFVGCAISSDIYVEFYDYYVDLIGCQVAGAVIHVDGAGSKVSSFGSTVSSTQVSLVGPGTSFVPYP